MIRQMLGLRRRVPVLMQSEVAECGLACLAMVAAFHGRDHDLPSLRHRHPVTSTGATLRELTEIAVHMQLSARAFKAPVQALERIRLPAILHWNFSHFVVLVDVHRKGALTIHDPARGRCVVTASEVDAAYTGIALELEPDAGFIRERVRHALPLRKLLRGALPDAKPVIHGLALALAVQLLSLVVPLIGKFMIDTIAPTRDALDIDVAGICIGVLAVCLGFAHFARGLTFVYLGNTLHRHLTQGLMEHLIDLPFSFFQRQRVTDLVSRFDSLRVIQRVISVTFIETIVDGLALVLTGALVGLESPWLALAGLATMSLYAVARMGMQQRFMAASEGQIIASTQVQTSFSESVRAIEGVKAHNARQTRLTSWNTLLARWFDANGRTQSQTVLFSALANGLQFATLGAALWIGGRQVSQGLISLGTLIACVSLLQTFAYRFVSLSDKVADYRMLGIHLGRLSDIYAVDPERLQEHDAVTLAPLEGRLALHDVWYRYSEHQPWILRGLNFAVDPGDFVAITGDSGAGKSTLLRVMLGLLDPREGTVSVDGTPLALYGKGSYRSQIAVVLQSDVLLSGTIGQNITFFDPLPDLDFMHECAALAGIHETISSLPMNYHTPVGDTTSPLSGGQQQRVFLARALYRRPRVLFLDEATSHLDLSKEREINAKISALGITRIVIAHRSETIRAASKVFHLKDGVLHEVRATETQD